MMSGSKKASWKSTGHFTVVEKVTQIIARGDLAGSDFFAYQNGKQTRCVRPRTVGLERGGYCDVSCNAL